MRKLILQIDVTLDGFVGGVNGELDWVKDDDEMNRDANALLTTVDTILLGRVAYQLFVEYWPNVDTTADSIDSQLAKNLNRAEKVVFSKTLDKVEWGKWDNARLVRGDIAEEIARMKAQTGKDMLLYAGANIVSTFIRLGLVDQYRLRVHPVMLGSGKPIFTGFDSKRDLKLVQTKQYQNGAVLLEYHNGK